MREIRARAHVCIHVRLRDVSSVMMGGGLKDFPALVTSVITSAHQQTCENHLSVRPHVCKWVTVNRKERNGLFHQKGAIMHNQK